MTEEDTPDTPDVKATYSVTGLTPHQKYLEFPMPDPYIKAEGFELFMLKDPISYIWSLAAYPITSPTPEAIVGKWDVLRGEWLVPLDRQMVKTFHWENNVLTED